MWTRINKKVLNHIIKRINESKTLKITHEWLICPEGVSKSYAELEFGKYRIENALEFIAKNKNNRLFIKTLHDSYFYCKLEDEVIFGNDYLDILAHSYHNNDENLKLVWRLYLD